MFSAKAKEMLMVVGKSASVMTEPEGWERRGRVISFLSGTSGHNPQREPGFSGHFTVDNRMHTSKC